MDLSAPVLPFPGYTPNFEARGLRTIILTTLSLCIIFSSTLVLLRLWTRFAIQRVSSPDDYAIFAAWISYIVYVALGFKALDFGYGIHLYDVSYADFFNFLRYANVLEVLYNPIMFLVKFGILYQFIRIFCPHKTGKTRIVIWFLVVFNFLFYTAIMLAQIFECTPVEKIWHPYLPGKCINLSSIFISGASVNVVSDLSILVLPLFKVWSLKLSTKHKIGVSSVFVTGIFACLSSMIRLENNLRFKKSIDVTHDLSGIALWTNAELTSGLLCACLPVVPAFFRHYVPKVRATLSGSLSKKSRSLTRSGDDHSRFASGGTPNLKDGSYIELNEHRDTNRLVTPA
ncbi:hypothetical protein CC86DRAFT_434629 [Ophiobolus disseminans]|uniref:Rhodopsin domain-containing protein n=1 Tax=Ophiobolus disseminans TaxID=1469910 RepID=A0A6A7AC71_9PLEO|nr:hypothetical protein CC86DRAFT_434629 [Ophiobolus disseminans]